MSNLMYKLYRIRLKKVQLLSWIIWDWIM